MPGPATGLFKDCRPEWEPAEGGEFRGRFRQFTKHRAGAGREGDTRPKERISRMRKAYWLLSAMPLAL